MQRRTFLALVPVAAVLGGCSKLKKLTGQTNDTVLPGQREDILPPDQHKAQKEDIDADPAAEPPVQQTPPATTTIKKSSDGVCDPEADPDCAPADGSGNDGIFSDG